MSEAHDILADVVADRAAFTTDPVVNLRTGLTFTAEIEPVDPLLVQSELGEDAREVVAIHVTSDTEAAKIKPQDLVQFRLFGVTVIYKIVKRRDNAAGVQTDFWAMQQVPGKDT
jgi:hypothetical protein